jgi:hypothetical protein
VQEVRSQSSKLSEFVYFVIAPLSWENAAKGQAGPPLPVRSIHDDDGTAMSISHLPLPHDDPRDRAGQSLSLVIPAAVNLAIEVECCYAVASSPSPPTDAFGQARRLWSLIIRLITSHPIHLDSITTCKTLPPSIATHSQRRIPCRTITASPKSSILPQRGITDGPLSSSCSGSSSRPSVSRLQPGFISILADPVSFVLALPH